MTIAAGLFEEYVPPEGDGRASLISGEVIAISPVHEYI